MPSFTRFPQERRPSGDPDLHRCLPDDSSSLSFHRSFHTPSPLPFAHFLLLPSAVLFILFRSVISDQIVYNQCQRKQGVKDRSVIESKDRRVGSSACVWVQGHQTAVRLQVHCVSLNPITSSSSSSCRIPAHEPPPRSTCCSLPTD